MKRLLFAILMLVCSVSWAEWATTGRTDANGGEVTFLHDSHTIRKVGAIAKMWIMNDYSVTQIVAGDRFKSEKILWAYNCREETMAIISLAKYSDSRGRGDSVFVNTNNENEWKWNPIIPGTIGDIHSKIACGKL
jgi:hypothetical protein